MNLGKDKKSSVPDEVKWQPQGCHCPQGQCGGGWAATEQEERTAFDVSAPEGVGREQNTRRPYLQEQSVNQKRERDRTGSCEEEKR